MPRKVLLGMLAVDLLLIGVAAALSLAIKGGWITDSPMVLRIGADRSVSEVFNGLKWAAIVILLRILWTRTRRPIALAFAVVFLLVAADDIFRLHENGGRVLARWFSLPPLGALKAKEVGEVLVWAALGVPSLLALALGFRAEDAAGRRMGARLLGLLGLLVLCAVGLDILHAAMLAWGLVSLLVGLLEDGGEMVVGSILTAHVLGLVLQSRHQAQRNGGPSRKARP